MVIEEEKNSTEGKTHTIIIRARFWIFKNNIERIRSIVRP